VPAAVALVIALMVAANVLTNRITPSQYLVTCLVTAVTLLTVARCSGLSWEELGLGRTRLPQGLRWAALAVVLIGIVYAIGLALPVTRTAFLDSRSAYVSAPTAAWAAFVRVPLGTVLLEEVAFRGVLWGMVSRLKGPGRATVVSSALFGLWHVLPSLHLTHANQAMADLLGQGRMAQAGGVLLAVASTTVAGVVFCGLRRWSDSILAPMGLHWATNGLGYLFSWAVQARL
jgi:uncharacterized protein